MVDLLKIESISYAFQDGRSWHSVLSKINVSLAKGERVAITGSSGSGKTTLLHIASGLMKPTEGSVLIREYALESMSEKQKQAFRAQHLGFVFQSPHFVRELTVLQNVMLPLMVNKHTAAEIKAAQILKKMGFSESMMNSEPSHLSGGEQSRASLARALVHQPEILIADEPTSALDHELTEEIFSYIIDIHQEDPFAMMVATHDHSLLKYFDKIFHLKGGKLEEV